MTSWRTTLTAFIGYAVILINKYTGLDLPNEVIIGLVICAVALFSKDGAVTGIGTKATDKIELDATKSEPKLNKL